MERALSPRTAIAVVAALARALEVPLSLLVEAAEEEFAAALEGLGAEGTVGD
ncbi:MAG: hypothetical protein WKF96_06705 [Solirubrobacteraceae bacterium]